MTNFSGSEDYIFFDYPDDYGYLMNLDCTEDGTVLVISGTDGVMDGTEEALNLCRNLEIDIIAVFLSKFDLVDDDDLISLFEMDVREMLSARGMEKNIPFIRGCARSAEIGYSEWEEGIEKLVEAAAGHF